MDLCQKLVERVGRDVISPYILGTLVLMGVVIGLVRLMSLSHASPAGVCPTVQNTQKFTFLYGEVVINATPAPPGSVVEARSPRGDTVGCRVVENAGEYPLMYVYGEETVAGTPIPGMREGEVIAFAVDGVPATPSPVPTWADDKASHQVDLSACIGDLDCDGDVDVDDIMQVASRWRCKCGDACYDPLYDLDDDCDIDIVDIMLVAARWGETCG